MKNILFHGQKTGDKSGFLDKSGEKWRIGKMKDFSLKFTNLNRKK